MNNNLIPKSVIEQIIESANIVDIIGSYVKLTPKGADFVGLCPFHDDHNASMSVSPEKHIYTCWSCGNKGHVVKFVQQREMIPFLEALKKCADSANIPLDIKVDQKYETHKPLYDIYQDTSVFYQAVLNSNLGVKAKKYLESRNITRDIIREFGIGLSLKERDKLTKTLINKKYRKNDMTESGLIIDHKSFGLQDIYVNRIMFPLEDLRGRIVGFSGRIYESFDKTKDSKYINSRESKIFKKSEILYNYKRAIEETRLTDQVIVMEGFMDVIRAHQVGIKNCVATMGTAISVTHANTLKSMASQIYLCFDGDAAGIKATASCIAELKKVGVTPKIIRLEDNMDPDDYITKFGVDAFKAKIQNAASVVDYEFDILRSSFDLTTDQEIANFIREANKMLDNLNDEILRSVKIKSLSRDTGLDQDLFKGYQENLQLIKNDLPKVEPTVTILDVKEEAKLSKLDKYQKAEIFFTYYLLVDKEANRLFIEKGVRMPSYEIRQLAREITSFYLKNEKIDLEKFTAYVQSNANLNKTFNHINSFGNDKIPDSSELLDYIRAIEEYNLKQQALKLKAKLVSCQNEEDSIRLLTQLKEVSLQLEANLSL